MVRIRRSQRQSSGSLAAGLLVQKAKGFDHKQSVDSLLLLAAFDKDDLQDAKASTSDADADGVAGSRGLSRDWILRKDIKLGANMYRES
jgi:hypothetical protein